MRSSVLLRWTVLAGSWFMAGLVWAGEPATLDIGSGRELLVDDFLIDRIDGAAELYLHKPIPREVVFVGDRDWEGNICAHFTVFRDDDRYRMYYRGQDYDEQAKKPSAHKVICYAESSDGRHWVRPELGLVSFEGSSRNNIIIDCLSGAARNGAFAVFKDANPNGLPETRYKALALHTKNGNGLYPYGSPDGVHWSLMADTPVITEGAFDSQNLAFWDAARHEYRAYWRYFDQRIRAIRTATSPDFLDWSEPVELRYPGAPREHLYTNGVLAYDRAPHLFVGFPTRFLPDRKSLTEGVFMTSRDGETFHRWGEAIIRPGLNADRWYNRSNYIWWGLVQTESSRAGTPPELSIYSHEAYYRGAAVKLRRFTYRLDGFVSLRARMAGGEMVTKPLTFSGKTLEINYATGAAGEVRVEIQESDGRAIPGYALADCPEIIGNQIERSVAWKGGGDVSPLAGRPIRLRFVLKDAHLYAIGFRP